MPTGIVSAMLLVAVLFGTRAHGAPITLDQEFVGDTGIGIVSPGAQSFTVGRSGKLARVEVELGGAHGELREYEVGLTRGGAGGAPLANYTEHYLFSARGVIVDTPEYHWIGFDLPNIKVDEGEVLFLYFTNLSSNGNFVNRGAVYESVVTDRYSDGALWVYDRGWELFRDFGADVSFRTYVKGNASGVPEPGTLALLAASIVGVVLASRGRCT
jgi:hypothetical protein